MNLAHFAERARQSGDLVQQQLNAVDFQNLLHTRIESLDVNSALDDVERFLRDTESLKLWSKDYFLQLSQLMKLT